MPLLWPSVDGSTVTRRALFIVIVTGSILDDAATVAIVASCSLYGTQLTWQALCPASTPLPSGTARASSSPSSSSGRRLFLRLHVMVRHLLLAMQHLMPLYCQASTVPPSSATVKRRGRS
jgi:hypothetical protein